ncbi:hypothetical protein PsYK624_115520 [Phanerochaete sordida]|uniref:Uncharacterized protein n=1 Tax=Phanerochaete sordida TaxID=48140 RepID=A0A9P3LHU4_9APHY|nr:hypothetical protein PsYK624_115520 [Phanerochaete sordida]
MYGRFTDGDVHTPRSRAPVRAIELHTDSEIMEWAMDMFDPDSVRSIELDFREAKWVRISAFDPFGPFLERYGVNIEHLSFGMPAGGIFPEREVESLTGCRNLRTLTLTTPRHNAWSSAYMVLRSLPPSVREIKMHLVADFDEYKEDDEPDMSTFDWQGLDEMLAQCTELAVLDVNVVLVEEDRYWAVYKEQQKAIWANVSPRIGRILRFV